MVEITGGKATVLGERVMRGDRAWKRERTPNLLQQLRTAGAPANVAPFPPVSAFDDDEFEMRTAGTWLAPLEPAKAAEAEAARRAEDEVLASLLPALSPALVSSSTSGAGAVTGAELDKAQQERARAPLPHLRASHRRHRQAPVSRRGMGGPRQ